MHGSTEYDLYKDTVLILYTLVDYYNVLLSIEPD